MTVDATAREYDVLRVLSFQTTPLNGSEIAGVLGWPRDSVSPRIVNLRANGMIEQQGTRPGPPPKFKTQMAYVITPRGLAFLSFARQR